MSAFCTLVTAFYPIRSKFSQEQYLQWAATFLTLEAPIVLFTTRDLAPTFQSLRSGRPLVIYDAPFSDLYMWATYEQEWRAHHAFDHEAFRHTPELYALWAQKAVFVNDVVNRNPFHTDYFFWCDIGAFRDGYIDPVVRATFPSTRHLVAERLALCSVRPLEEGETAETLFQFKDRLVGGLWGGDAEACRRWRQAYEEVLKEYLQAGRFAGKDQSVMLTAYLKDPTLAVVYRPPTVEDWFYFTRLHSDLGLEPVLDATFARMRSLKNA